MTAIGKILIVDDSESLVRMVEGVLRRQDFDVQTAFDGKAGWEKARQYLPDLIVRDGVMPEMDGYEVCRRLHDDPATAHIPVILLTVKGQVDDPDLDSSTLEARIAEQMLGYDVGAVDFIPKPVKAGALVERIKSHLVVDRAAQERRE
jgi:DNA-binding response OmpR family regulator